MRSRKWLWLVAVLVVLVSAGTYPLWTTWITGITQATNTSATTPQRHPLAADSRGSAAASSLATAQAIAQTQKKRPYRVELGTAVQLDVLTSETPYRDTLTSHFTSITPENALDFRWTEPGPGVYDFKAADDLVDFAVAHNMTVFGNGLVWYQAVPDWLKNGQYTRSQVIAILHDHIYTVMSRYRGRIDSWEVVNEALSNDGSALRDNFWLQKIGPDYIAMAFRWAREADPDATLYYNDYGAEMPGPKFEALYNLVTGLKKEGTPISGVGFQMHVNLSYLKPTMQGVSANFVRINSLGLKIRITEMDVRGLTGNGATQQQLDEQANLYGSMATLCMHTKACVALTVWGVTDKYTWIDALFHTEDRPLLFDRSYRPKPAFYAVRYALKTP